VSKNVAVFVDVANIFYAAKAAGVDIDYVTLLKSAIAGRDFVRAYAYTGLDPENENQRQFHQFLARSGYKVVSKDIRKYGDGKIKANLDIELVVDMLRTAQNLDIAVVVSGDGDFAPAIRAVQQMGVRVEVISFRGNTSSDLIDVADVFTDIAQVARVEKGSSRSGRRVAAEGDLSMTEVPDKETEGAPRRRRGGRGRSTEREAASARVAASSGDAGSMPGNLIVLPGEKLSRAVGTAGGDGEEEEERSVANGAGGVSENDSGRRRRRRRGGRGRGRARTDTPLAPAGGTEEEDDGADYHAPRLPQASTFGSIWDSQLGVPTAVPVSGEPVNADEEDFEDEPEIPEYLLAERRQRGARGGRPSGPRGGRAAYQSAVERERFGRGAGRSQSFGATPSYAGPRSDRRDDRSRRGGRPAGGGRGGRGGVDRPQFRPSPTGDPWSEVPPELEELLRAQIAQKGQPRGDEGGTVTVVQDGQSAPAERSSQDQDVAGENGAPETAAPTRTRAARAPRAAATGRRRTSETAGAKETAEAPKKRTTKRAAGDVAKPSGRSTTRAGTTTRKRATPSSRSTDPGAPDAAQETSRVQDSGK
jgi:uncharacterized LabA/DUF88 family protein